MAMVRKWFCGLGELGCVGSGWLGFWLWLVRVGVVSDYCRLVCFWIELYFEVLTSFDVVRVRQLGLFELTNDQSFGRGVLILPFS